MNTASQFTREQLDFELAPTSSVPGGASLTVHCNHTVLRSTIVNKNPQVGDRLAIRRLERMRVSGLSRAALGLGTVSFFSTSSNRPFRRVVPFLTGQCCASGPRAAPLSAPRLSTRRAHLAGGVFQRWSALSRFDVRHEGVRHA